MKKLIFAIALPIALYVNSYGQDVKVSAAFDSTRIYIGDQIKFTITVDKPSGLKLSIPSFKDTICKNIEIVSGPVIDSSTASGRTKLFEKYLVTSFDSGFYQVKPVYAEIRSSSGIKRFYSEYSPLEVMRLRIAPPDTAAKIFDIIKPYRAPITLGELLPWILALLIASALAYAAIRYFRKLKRTKGEEEVIINPDPAHVIAFRELEKLRNEQLWQKGELKNYYTRLTEILRQYLENRFGVYSLEMTTSETLEELLKTGFKKDASYDLLKTVLNGADLVKFAKYIPDPDENEEQFRKAWDFVMATKQQEEVLEPVENGLKKEETA